jgi:hypothetical protein
MAEVASPLAFGKREAARADLMSHDALFASIKRRRPMDVDMREDDHGKHSSLQPSLR